ncbi:MAG: hypothetical protein QME74_05510 [Candidatus Edwardsbacteria bacterium]|nr:hypothetical protein [Candidatus Edwardsbacteria bacterium]
MDDVTIRLSDIEAEIALKACRAYKQRIPSYIEANKGEIGIIDSIIGKLSQEIKKTKG